MQFVDRILELCATDDTKHKAKHNYTIVPITKVTAMVSLDVTGIIALGTDFEIIVGKNHEIVEAHEMLFSNSKDKRLLFLLYNIAPQWVLDLLRIPVANKMDHAHNILANICRQILRERNLGRSNLSDETNAIAQLVVIVGGGYESIGSTLAWVVYCLARHPEAQEDLRKELAEFCDSLGNLKADAEYDKLPVLNAVVMEATRLYPAFTLLFRKAIRDTMIGEQPIRKGTFVGMCPRAINYAHHLWGPDAAKFIPG
ncbi:hypothetical protein N7537_004388 [Penicillium hordei]|uniref:Cytochrome P450 n=1 Tax=Penicillium hordei TaxID=40994 RepID=A0AAD6H3V0_9EURO|nr:uncharacterized protein N7537_004388 [Penicillium hordei]KAJ5607769.1 hypothetical protein N7537_004388 [Penicillium hordei]